MRGRYAAKRAARRAPGLLAAALAKANEVEVHLVPAGEYQYDKRARTIMRRGEIGAVEHFRFISKS